MGKVRTELVLDALEMTLAQAPGLLPHHLPFGSRRPVTSLAFGKRLSRSRSAPLHGRPWGMLLITPCARA
jgi:hypothetical protein